MTVLYHWRVHSYLNAGSNKGTLTSRKQKVQDVVRTSSSEIGWRKMFLCPLSILDPSQSQWGFVGKVHRPITVKQQRWTGKGLCAAFNLYSKPRSPEPDVDWEGLNNRKTAKAGVRAKNLAREIRAENCVPWVPTWVGLLGSSSHGRWNQTSCMHVCLCVINYLSIDFSSVFMALFPFVYEIVTANMFVWFNILTGNRKC